MLSAFAQNNTTLADVKTDVISNLQKDGYLSEKMANEAAQKYVTPKDAQTVIKIVTPESNGASTQTNNSNVNMTESAATAEQAKATVNWTQYLSWINFLKVAGSALLIIAFWGFIKIVIKNTWHIITLVPPCIYQAVFLCASIFASIFPEYIWESQAFYVALIASFTNLIILGWIVVTYQQIIFFLEKIFNFGIPLPTIASFWAMIYFGIFAIAYESSIFGFFAAIALSGIFSFTMMYSPGVLFLYFKENALAAVVFGHILVLLAYTGVWYSGIADPYAQYFNAGIQYYCSIALGVGLLVGASPFYKPEQAGAYFMLFLLVVAGATGAYFFLSMTAMATILFIFFVLVFVEWIGYVGFKAGWVAGCAVVGAMLYGFSLLMESFGPIIMNNIKQMM